ncbi:MAG: ribonuclease III [Chloroflexi bacterium]|nr:ribonuclease III [Chloroflexota bacterium]
MTGLDTLQRELGVVFRNTSLLGQALRHMSYINENPGFAGASNERMEFLGDAVLGLVIAEKLYQDFPDMTEGQMTGFRAAVVRGDALARIARAVNLGDYLYLGKGEEASGGRKKASNLASALEAVIAAIFLDRGLESARSFILRLFGKEMEKAMSREAVAGYKSKLQEFVQSKSQQMPTYHLIEAVGPDHAREFTVEVRVGDKALGRGKGKSKKMAEEEAARSALEPFDRLRASGKV